MKTTIEERRQSLRNWMINQTTFDSEDIKYTAGWIVLFLSRMDKRLTDEDILIFMDTEIVYFFMLDLLRAGFGLGDKEGVPRKVIKDTTILQDLKDALSEQVGYEVGGNQ